MNVYYFLMETNIVNDFEYEKSTANLFLSIGLKRTVSDKLFKQTNWFIQNANELIAFVQQL